MGRELEAMRDDWLRRRAAAQQQGLDEAFANAFRPPAEPSSLPGDEEPRRVSATPAEFERMRRPRSA